MAEVILPDRSIYEPTTAEEHPPVTTPQGTQAHSVEKGHERRDLNVRALIMWLAFLSLIVLLTYVLLWGMFNALNWFQNRKDVMPSPLFGAQTVPPEPRLLPNPADSRSHPEAPMTGPGEAMVEERKLQLRQMEALGLYDAGSGQYRIPEDVIDAVTKEGSPAVPPPIGGGTTETKGLQGTMMPLPSDSSGGRSMENGLR